MVNAGEISPDKSGGSSVYYSHLELLYALNYDIHLIVCLWNNERFNPSDYARVDKFISETIQFDIAEAPVNKGIKRMYMALFDPMGFEYAFINKKNIDGLRQLLDAQKYDLIWCEWRWTAILYAQLGEDRKAIYSHHDWEYKLSKHKNKRSMKQRFHQLQKKRAEFALVKRFSASISGSQTEAQEIATISKKSTLYLPTTYDVKENVENSKELSLVHLGGMNTTANRLGLERFLDVCWERIKQSHPSIKLMIIGSVSDAHTALLTKLEDPNIAVKGFVQDLDTQLFAKDIHIIPWEYNTGTRTRLPVALNYEQAVVATKASIKAFPEMINDKNVLLCDTLEEMTTRIQSLLEDPEKRKQLSTSGKETFLRVFTVGGQKEILKTFIESI